MSAWFQDLPLDFTRPETRAARDALVVGYPMNMALLMVAKHAGLDLAQLNQMAPVAYLAVEILEKARAAGRLEQLLAEVLLDPMVEGVARETLGPTLVGFEADIRSAVRKPSVQRLAQLPPAWDLQVNAAPREALAGAFEKLINLDAGFADISRFRQGLAEAEVRVGRVEVGGHNAGSGFLVADDLFMTNRHVARQFGGASVVVRFDAKLRADGTEANPGRPVELADDWLVAQSEHHPIDAELSDGGPALGQWDYALLRLAEPIGAMPLGEGGEPRGHLRITDTVWELQPGATLLIVGHPKGRPMQLSVASPAAVKFTADQARVRYGVNTDGGSSGSPVFDKHWNVVALHHVGKSPDGWSGRDPGFNQGIPMWHIAADLRAKLAGTPDLKALGLADFLG